MKRFCRGKRNWRILLGNTMAALWIMALPPALAENPMVQPQIVGGQETSQTWPWMAALVYAGQTDVYRGFFCGGSLIAPSWVVTAAHCVASESPDGVDVVLGVHDLKQDLSNGIGQRLAVKRIITHPRYNRVTEDSDIALLELQQAVNYTTVTPYSGRRSLAGQSALALGWGSTKPRGKPDYPAVLQEVSLPIITNSACVAAMGPGVSDDMLCAGYTEGGKDTCRGDSGGPLLVSLAGEYQLVGITSWGDIACAQPGQYGVYTRVAQFDAFIQDSMKSPDAFACADQDGNGVVDKADQARKREELKNEFNQWLQQCWSTQAACGDINGDGVVDNADKKARRRAMNDQYSQWLQNCWYPARPS